MQARAQHTAVYVGRTRWYETEAVVRAGEPDIAAEDVRRFGERVGQTSRFRIPFPRAPAVLAEERGDVIAAIQALEDAGQLAESCGFPGEAWPIEAALDRLYRTREAVDEARRAGENATRILQELASRLHDTAARATFLRAASASMGS
ncbi:MAG: hypothetical protein M3069_03205 [Chloroflexota bacterium]|nr:hypothetical protein [Chloroflexota bacterium]